MDVVVYALCKKYAKNYTDEAIKALAKGLVYKGTVSTTADLPIASEDTKGWMYTISENGHEYVCDGLTWVDLSEDLDNFLKKMTNFAAGDVPIIGSNGQLTDVGYKVKTVVNDQSADTDLPTGKAVNTELKKKVDKQQSVSDAGKVLGIGDDGVVTPVEVGGGLPDPTGLPNGTAIVVVDGEWKIQDGYGYESMATYFEVDQTATNFTLNNREYYKISDLGTVLRKPISGIVDGENYDFESRMHFNGSDEGAGEAYYNNGTPEVLWVNDYDYYRIIIGEDEQTEVGVVIPEYGWYAVDYLLPGLTEIKTMISTRFDSKYTFIPGAGLEMEDDGHMNIQYPVPPTEFSEGGNVLSVDEFGRMSWSGSIATKNYVDTAIGGAINASY